MKWLIDRLHKLFHEPRDAELTSLTDQLEIETEIHYRESKRINNAMIIEEYERLEEQRQRGNS